MKFLLRVIPILLLIAAIKNQQSEAGTDRYRTVQFYGHELGFFYHPVLDDLHLTDLENNQLRSQIDRLRQHQLNMLTQRLVFTANKYQLDDLGKFMLVKQMSNQWMRHKSQNEQVLLQYVLLKNLGYDVLLSRTGDRLNCFGRLDFTPRRYVYIHYNGKKYVNLKFDEALNGYYHQIYKDAIPSSGVIRGMRGQLPAIHALTTQKQLQFEWLSDTVTARFTANQSMIDYFYDLPSMPIGQSFVQNTLSSEVKSSLYPILRENMKGMNRANQLRYLLAFVQQSIPYGSDFDKYGKDYFYFPEQTLTASNADCEDKAFLLATLASDLLGLHSVALHFKKDEHLGIAFELPGFRGGQVFTYRGKRYVPCEPTANRPVLAYSAYDLSRIAEVIDLI